MVRVPVRPAPLFAAAVTVTVPFPVPGAPLATLSHGSFGAAVHEHHDPPEIENAIAPPPDAIAWLDGATDRLQAAAACDTVNVWLAIVTVPLRAAAAFASTLSVTVPLAVPVDPSVTAIHGALLTAFQLQKLALAVTVIATALALALTDALAGVRVYAQAIAACDTVTVWPPIFSEPVRAGPVFSATETDTVPLPAPVAPLATVSQLSTAFADQAHVVNAVTVNAVVPALDETD